MLSVAAGGGGTPGAIIRMAQGEVHRIVAATGRSEVHFDADFRRDFLGSRRLGAGAEFVLPQLDREE